MKHFLKRVVPLAAIAIGLATTGCDKIHIGIGDGDGVPLADLDMSGDPPTGVALASSDRVVIREGDKLDIAVDGDRAAIDALRFTVDDKTLGIMRERGSDADGKATVTVTMPVPRQLMLAGSGDIDAPQISDETEINIAGSGKVVVAKVAANRLRVNVLGSGTLIAAGTAKQLDFNLAGSGKLSAKALKVENADINIAGSGGGEFASDGKVHANVAGSGEVTVHGRADCKISALGSGKLHCTMDDPGPVPEAKPTIEAPSAPAAPEAPEAPKA